METRHTLIFVVPSSSYGVSVLDSLVLPLRDRVDVTWFERDGSSYARVDLPGVMAEHFADRVRAAHPRIRRVDDLPAV